MGMLKPFSLHLSPDGETRPCGRTTETHTCIWAANMLSNPGFRHIFNDVRLDQFPTTEAPRREASQSLGGTRPAHVSGRANFGGIDPILLVRYYCFSAVDGMCYKWVKALVL